MKLCLRVIFIISILLQPSYADSDFNSDTVVQRDAYLLHHTYRKTSAYSLYACSTLCQMSPVCRSFGFHPHTNTCHLNDDVGDDDDFDFDDVSGDGDRSEEEGGGVQKWGYVYSEIDRWPECTSGPCRTVTCEEGTSCHVNRFHKASCVPESLGCGEPPDVTGAVKSYDGIYDSALVIYTCNPDHVMCNMAATSICRGNGQWEDRSGLCGRFRFNNPAGLVEYRFPCGESNNFNISMTISTVGNSDFQIEFRDATNNIPFLVHFRSISSEVAANSYIGGVNGTEVIADGKPIKVTHQPTIQISLIGGVYTVKVDGVTFHTFGTRSPGVRPDRIFFTNGATVVLMDIQAQTFNYNQDEDD